MKRYKIGIVRVITLEDEVAINSHGKLLEQYFPMFETISRCIPDQYTGINDDDTLHRGIPKVIQLVKEFEQSGCDAVIISCAGDPALKECRRMVSIPVIGAGESVAAISKTYGDHPGDIGITEKQLLPYQQILGERCVGYRRGKLINGTLDLSSEEGYLSTLEVARELKEKGADVIALSCTGMSANRYSYKLEKDLQIPVIDPILSEGTMLLNSLLRLEHMKCY